MFVHVLGCICMWACMHLCMHVCVMSYLHLGLADYIFIVLKLTLRILKYEWVHGWVLCYVCAHGRNVCVVPSLG